MNLKTTFSKSKKTRNPNEEIQELKKKNKQLDSLVLKLREEIQALQIELSEANHKLFDMSKNDLSLEIEMLEEIKILANNP